MTSSITSVSPVTGVQLLSSRLQPKSTRVAISSSRSFSASAKHYDGSEDLRVQRKQSDLKDYFQQSRDLFRSDGGPPRWFSPLDCASQLENSPLLLYLPGFDGTGNGLSLHHQRLGEIFDVWCLHIPATDRTPFQELVKLVERTVRSEHYRAPKRPIYLVGESVGGCLALSVAAYNPDIDLILILVNPATCFSKSTLSSLMPLLHVMPKNLPFGLPFFASLITDIPSRIAKGTVDKGLPFQQAVEELSKIAATLSSFVSGVVDTLPVETLVWKLKMFESASSYANSRVHAVKAQTLILASGKDQLLPSQEEGQRLWSILPNCEIRAFDESSHSLLLDDSHDLVTILKGASYYRRGRQLDYASDYLPPLQSEFKKSSEPFRWLNAAMSPVMLTTTENGKITRGLDGIPLEGPVLFVGYHNMMGFEIYPLIMNLYEERNILLRGLAHPQTFRNKIKGEGANISWFDSYRVMGAAPVSPTNLFRLLSSNSHVLLYPGGAREALHRKGEEYKLFWPEQSEFVRMAAKFGAKIIPFGAVGEDDLAHLLLDYDEQMKIPYWRDFVKYQSESAIELREGTEGEVGNQNSHLPILLPKLPGRYYYYFSKPIETAGREVELKDKQKANELYLEVKAEVQNCLSYLKDNREKDPYRSILARAVYQATHGPESQIPTFKI